MVCDIFEMMNKIILKLMMKRLGERGNQKRKIVYMY